MGRAKKASSPAPSPTRTSPVSRRRAAAATAEAAGGDHGAARSKAKSSLGAHKAIQNLFEKLTFASAESGEVFVVGSGDCGQLGFGPDVTSKLKLGRLDYFSDKEIVDVAAGGLHNVALGEDGKLYSWGCNDQRALGRSGEETEPAPVEGLDGIKIVRVVCGDSFTAALSEDGLVYAWGTFRNSNGLFGFRPTISIQNTPALIPELKRIIHLHAGANHIVALTSDHKIFTWGCGEQGQLGRRIMPRSEKESSLIPRQVNFRPPRSDRGGSTKIASAYCGGHHTFISLEDGRLFSFGLNNHGQLGLGDLETHSGIEQVIGLDAGKGVKMVVGAEHHSILLDNEGRVSTFGRNEDHQLGVGDDTTAHPTPTLLSEPTNVHTVSANGAFSMALTSESSDNLWMWGYGGMGQLCNQSTDDDEAEPLNIDLKGRRALRGGCGGQHTLLLLSRKE
ncbi:Regulator of chromosome condensation [Chytridiales sp. JEL 0842]|nr:Regulator of chromosome condensation [Chytridiales sp. JEL 0842]